MLQNCRHTLVNAAFRGTVTATRLLPPCLLSFGHKKRRRGEHIFGGMVLKYSTPVWNWETAAAPANRCAVAKGAVAC